MPLTLEADVAIVGGGTAGAILASRISEDPSRSVLLVESGPDYGADDRLPDELRLVGRRLGSYVGRHDWGLEGFPVDGSDRRMEVPRGRVLGGCSAMNGTIYLRGTPGDFEEWSRLARGDLDYEGVLRSFCKVETDLDVRGDYHGSSGPVPVRRATPSHLSRLQEAWYESLRDAGLRENDDMNGPDPAGVGLVPMNNLDGRRISTASAYLDGARRRPNLRIVAETTVQRLIVQRSRAVGLAARRHDDDVTVRAGEIVLSAGAIGSAVLLLRSGVGDGAALRAAGIPVVRDLPGVGARLEDHPTVTLELPLAEGVTVDPEGPMVQVGARLRSPFAVAEDDLLAYAVDSVAPTGAGGAPVGSSAVLLLLAKPESTGTLTLDPADPDGPPVLRFGYLATERDRRQLRWGIRWVLDRARSAGYGDLVRVEQAAVGPHLGSAGALDDWCRRHVRTGHHCACTCRMGPEDDPLAVTDPAFKVRGVDGLRVVDASVMPSIVGANTNATTMMLAELAAGEL